MDPKKKFGKAMGDITALTARADPHAVELGDLLLKAHRRDELLDTGDVRGH